MQTWRAFLVREHMFGEHARTYVLNVPRTSQNAVLLNANTTNIANIREHCEHGCEHMFREHVFANMPNQRFLYVISASIGTCSDTYRQAALMSNLVGKREWRGWEEQSSETCRTTTTYQRTWREHSANMLRT